jgi:hypothetical protein
VVVERSDMIRNDIEQTRAQMGNTLDALGYKATSQHEPSISGDRFDGRTSLRRGAKRRRDPDRSRPRQGHGRAHPARARTGRRCGRVRRRHLRALNEDRGREGRTRRRQVKTQAVEAGQEALEHGKQVAQAAAESAVETAKAEGKQRGEELSSSLQEKAGEVAPTSPSS